MLINFLVESKVNGVILIKTNFCKNAQRKHNKKLNNGLQSYTKYRPNETKSGIFVSWQKEERCVALVDYTPPFSHLPSISSSRKM